jgi:2-hydroxychromene-2-carboxylate isomerase
MASILGTLGVAAKPVLTAAQSEANKTRLRAETAEAQRLGLFGAPTFVTADGELFWGNDRLEQALRWAKRCA